MPSIFFSFHFEKEKPGLRAGLPAGREKETSAPKNKAMEHGRKIAKITVVNLHIFSSFHVIALTRFREGLTKYNPGQSPEPQYLEGDTRNNYPDLGRNIIFSAL